MKSVFSLGNALCRSKTILVEFHIVMLKVYLSFFCFDYTNNNEKYDKNLR
jgi:hypothetical protein